jgi:predicted ABC-type ATPase
MPDLYVIGGPNGAGKTTVAMRLFPEIVKSGEFVNADIIAKGLSGFNSESVAMAAGRLMVGRLHELRSMQKDFSFESTLASRSLLPFIDECRRTGYVVTLIYVWVESAEIAIERVRKRVSEGGHLIPEEVVRRRYERSVSNVVNLYLPNVDRWKIYDNTFTEPRTGAVKELGVSVRAMMPERMRRIKGVIKEPEGEYVPDKIDLLVKAAIVEELDRKRKLGLPIVFGADGKVIVMIGDKIVEERPYDTRS